jgi:hypothetical protein
MKITVEVPIEDGDVIANAIERVADAGDAALGLEFVVGRKAARLRDAGAPGEPSANGWRAQQADALLAIAKATLAGGLAGAASAVGRIGAGGHADPSAAESASTSVADHYQVVVHVDDSALRGRIGRSELPMETVKRLTCDCSVINIVENEHGTPLDVGRKKRTVSTPMRRALWSRDRSCTLPGVATGVSWTRTTSGIGQTAVTRTPLTSRCSVGTIIGSCTRVGSTSGATVTASAISYAPTGA